MQRRGPKGIWHIRYYDQHGLQRRESTRTADYETARRILNDRESAKLKGAAVSPTLGRLTFDQAVAAVETDWLMNDRDTVAELQARIVNHLRPYFGGRRMAAITTAEIAGYATARKTAGAKNATINNELAIIRRAFTLAIRTGLLLARPYMPRLKPAPARRGFFEREAFEAVRAALPAELQPIATVAYHTGWRVASEVLPLEWRQVDRAAGVIRLDPGQTKNGEGRVFPYGRIPELVDAIEMCWTHHEALMVAGVVTAHVFVRWAAGHGADLGDPVKSWRGAWVTARTAAGQPGRLVHDFRRTAARNLERAGVPRTHGKKLIGHLTDEMYDRYAIANEADLAASLEKLEGLEHADGLHERQVLRGVEHRGHGRRVSHRR